MNRPDLFRGKRRRMPRQERSRRRREAVLRAAIVSFGRDGYEGASIRDIARGAGVPTGTVYQLFGSKRELLLISMDTLLTHLEQFGPPPFGKGKSLLADLERFLEEIFARELPFQGVYRAWQEAALIDPTIAKLDRRIRDWTRTRIRNLFSLLAGIPGARPELNLALLAELWDRFFWNLLADPPSDRKGTIQSIAETLYRTLFFDTSDRGRPVSEPGRPGRGGDRSGRRIH